MQTCATVEEFRTVVASQLPRLFEGDVGALYLFEAEAARGGRRLGRPRAAQRKDSARRLLALRRNRAHYVESGTGSLLCRHLDRSGAPYACVPLIAQGEALGALHVRPHDKALTAEGPRRPFMQTVAENLALGLANVRLREALRSQAIRDPLTGLYNRRFMEETIEYELRLAARRGTPLSLVMADVITSSA